MKTVFENDDDYLCDIQAPCFQELQPDEMKLIQSGKTQVIFRKGDSLTKQGAFASYVLFIVTGYAKQYLEGDGQRDFNLRVIRPGEFVGLSVVFSGNTFSYSSVALTDCRVFLVEKQAIATLIRQNGNFGFGIIKRYCELNSRLFRTIDNLFFHQMNGRMAGALLYLDGFKEENPGIFQLLSRKDLAGFAGVSTESGVKLLKSFEKDGLIRLNEKDITVIDHEKLGELARIG